jgi:ATP-dependent Lhr-like helicase
MQGGVEFHPSVAAWFRDCFPRPTEVQAASWPVIASGAHALITAPTGSGKTLTAFMWSLSQFAAGDHEPGRTRVLYVSPLKALNNDIQRNLLEPLTKLEREYQFPQVRVATRSGDTSQSERQRLLRRPPDILITTPESLSLLLTTSKGRIALAHVDTVILDEIHSIVDNRRGAQLMTGIERLASIAGEFQRIALSATVAPLETVAAYVGGADAEGNERHVEIVNTPGEKQIEFRVRFPEAARKAAEEGKKIWDPLSESFREIIDGNDATLFFTNSRRLAEKITLKINEEQIAPVAYAHHGSLAREVRTEVESRLKAGELRAIVATNSLEMGIDIGHLDEVVMVQSPPSVASTLQRIGRAGHRVGEVSIGTLYPTHAQDFLEAAALAKAVDERDIEPLRPMRSPLDVLAQIIVSITATDAWPIDDVYDLITRAGPYRNLDREHFDLVVEMMSGRYSGARVRELKPRLVHDRIASTIKASKGAVLAMYNSGGTIPDRGYYQLRHVDTGGVLGELDEEFVWEATVGDVFTLGTQDWQIQRITHNDVIVRAAKPGRAAPPFWRNENFHRSFHFSSRIGQYLELAEGRFAIGEADGLEQELENEAGFEACAAQELVGYLERQRIETGAALPHRHHLLLELIKAGPAGYRGPDDPQQLVIHTFWGGNLNQPFALALQAAWQARFGSRPDAHADNNAIVIQCKGEPDPHEILTLVTRENFATLLRASLEQSGFFGARFRECAGRSLLLSKRRFNQRMPLWMTRLQAKKLMTNVRKFSDFPVMVETWRTCLDDEFDLPALDEILGEIADGTVSWSLVTTTTPSPFAHNLTFGQVGRYMYADDTPEDGGASVLSDDLISQALHNDALRPRIEPSVIEEFVAKRQRRFPGYEPASAEDWGEWLKERILIPTNDIPSDADLPEAAIRVEDGTRAWVTHAELVHALHASGLVESDMPTDAARVEDSRSPTQLAREILSFYGPLTEVDIAALLPSVPADLLLEDEAFICGTLVQDDEGTYWCDAENFETLMRFQRAQRRSQFTAKDIKTLPTFWAALHRLAGPDGEEALLYAMENLRGYAANVNTWLDDLLPARVAHVPLQDALTSTGMTWRGAGNETITVGYPEDLDLVAQTAERPSFASQFRDPNARYGFSQIADKSSRSAGDLNEDWWQAVWQGQLACETLAPLKQGRDRKFKLTEHDQRSTSRRRARLAPVTWPGAWHLAGTQPIDDPLTQLEADKERVRLLIDRYGFVNREIVSRENLPTTQGRPWRWRDAFRALRLMELAGEVVTGQFFTELATPQFISPRALASLQGNLPAAPQFWMSALDPTAPCGLRTGWESLPQRRQGNYLAFSDGELALTVEGTGRHLNYHVPWDDPNLDAIHAVLSHLVEERRQTIRIATINGARAKESPYLGPLGRLFEVSQDHKDVFLQPSF